MLRSLAAKLSSRPRRTLSFVLVFVVLAAAIGGPIAGALKSSGGFAPPNSDSQVAIRMLESANGADPTSGIVLLVKTPRGASASGPRIAAIVDRLKRVPGVLHAAGPTAVSRDGREVLVTGTLRASADDQTVAKAALAAFAPGPDVTVGGSAVADEQISSTVIKDLGFAELLAFPLLIGLSILFFRGRAALMPLAVGIVTVLGTFLLLTGINHLYGLSVFALNLVIGMGLGLAVDYTLFIVTRFREELARGEDVREAIAVTMSRAGRTVLFSAATVACALATLTLFPQGFLKSMGIAGATVAIVAALAAVTVSPALLGLWGRKLARRGAGARRWWRRPLVPVRQAGHAPPRRGRNGDRGDHAAGGAPRAERRLDAGDRQRGDPERAERADGRRRARNRFPRRRPVTRHGRDPRRRLRSRRGDRLCRPRRSPVRRRRGSASRSCSETPFGS